MRRWRTSETGSGQITWTKKIGRATCRITTTAGGQPLSFDLVKPDGWVHSIGLTALGATASRILPPKKGVKRPETREMSVGELSVGELIDHRRLVLKALETLETGVRKRLEKQYLDWYMKNLIDLHKKGGKQNA